MTLKKLFKTPDHRVGLCTQSEGAYITLQFAPNDTQVYLLDELVPYTMPSQKAIIDPFNLGEKVIKVGKDYARPRVQVMCVKHGYTRWVRLDRITKRKGCTFCQSEWAGHVRMTKARCLDGKKAYLHLVKAIQAKQRANPSKPELAVFELLKDFNIPFAQQPIIETQDRYFLPDFAGGWRQGVGWQWILEVNGQYWHSKEKRSDRDYALQCYCARNGIQLFVVSDVDIKDNWEGIADEIKSFFDNMDTSQADWSM
jgi:hypothetical protein